MTLTNNRFTVPLSISRIWKTGLAVIFISFLFGSCGIYSFKDVSIPADVKTIHLGYIENKARYVNPTLSPQLTDQLKQKINNQTRLTQVQTSDADWDVNASITAYDISTAAVSNQKSSTNRLTVTVHISFKANKGSVKDYEADISRNFDFDAGTSFSQAEPALIQQILPAMTTDIFNRLFSNW